MKRGETMPQEIPGYYKITIPEHYIEHNGHFDFHSSHIGYIQEGEVPVPPSHPPQSAAPEGYTWIGLPRHFDYHNDHFDIEEAHWGLSQGPHSH
jgi:hypothetical protein